MTDLFHIDDCILSENMQLAVVSRCQIAFFLLYSDEPESIIKELLGTKIVECNAGMTTIVCLPCNFSFLPVDRVATCIGS